MDENILRLKHDKKLISLEKQVEYFRSQALRLKSEREGRLYSTEFVLKITLLAERLDCAEQDKNFFEAFVIEARKENKELKEQLATAEKNAMTRIESFAKKYTQGILNKEAESNKMIKRPVKAQVSDTGYVSYQGEGPGHFYPTSVNM